MIKINLLPTTLRKKDTLKTIPLQAIIYFTTIIVVALHMVVFVLTVYKKVQFGSLNKSWEERQPQFKEIDGLKKDLVLKREKARVMDQMLARNIYFTEFFNKINLAVPKGLWLNRLSFSINDGLVILGSVFAFDTEPVSLVNKFFNDLKSNEFFVANFSNFNLDSVQRRLIKEYEVLDFLLTADVKKERFEIEYNNKAKR
jgi:Tfp pilus assembly protein PilN